MLLQVVSSAAPTEHPAASAPCSISVSGSASGPNSVSLTLTTAGLNCSFSVASPDVGTDAAECRRVPEWELQGNQTDRPRGAGGGVFTCALDHLEPGAAYLLQVRSQTDNESASATLHTSELQKQKLRFD